MRGERRRKEGRGEEEREEGRGESILGHCHHCFVEEEEEGVGLEEVLGPGKDKKLSTC